MVLLNALHLSQELGCRVAMTWFTNTSHYQALVADIGDIFSGPLLEPFADDGDGVLIDVERLKTWRTKSSVEIVRVSQDRDIGTHDAFVTLSPDALDGVDAFVVDRRFSLYAARPADTYHDVRKRIADIFTRLPFSPTMRSIFRSIDLALPCREDFLSLHVRRLHYHQNSDRPTARATSFLSTSAVSSFLDAQDRRRRFLFCSDSEILRNALTDRFGDRLMTLRDVLDISHLSPIQLTLADLYFLSRSTHVFGSRSTIGLLASLIGDCGFTDMLSNAHVLGLKGDDPTGYVALSHARAERSQARMIAAMGPPEPHLSALYWRLAHDILEGGCDTTDVDLPRLALTTLATRFSCVTPTNFRGDTDFFLTLAIRTHESLDDSADLRILRALASLIATRTLDDRHHLEALMHEKSAQELDPCTAVAVFASLGDYDSEKAPERALYYYRTAVRAAADASIKPVGILGKLAELEAQLGDTARGITTITRAIQMAPAFSHLRFIHGSLLARAGDLQGSRDALQAALALEPENGEYLKAAADAAWRIGDLTTALRYLRQAVESDPGHKDWMLALDRLQAEGDRTRRPAVKAGQPHQ